MTYGKDGHVLELDNAEIIINDQVKRKEPTPTTIDLFEGQYRVKVNKEGYYCENEELADVPESDIIKIHITLIKK